MGHAFFERRPGDALRSSWWSEISLSSGLICTDDDRHAALNHTSLLQVGNDPVDTAVPAGMVMLCDPNLWVSMDPEIVFEIVDLWDIVDPSNPIADLGPLWINIGFSLVFNGPKSHC